MKNFHATSILNAIKYIKCKYPNTPLTIVEVGCMFSEDEGLSTIHLANAIHSHDPSGKLISIEYEKDNIKKCKDIINKYNSNLLTVIEFHCSHSLDFFRNFNESTHIFSLDGGHTPRYI